MGRFNKTLKCFLLSHDTLQHQRRVDVLPLVIDKYNHIAHDSTRIAPTDLEDAAQRPEMAHHALAMTCGRNGRWLRKYGKPFKAIHVGTQLP